MNVRVANDGTKAEANTGRDIYSDVPSYSNFSCAALAYRK
jgi:hypothetical protein